MVDNDDDKVDHVASGAHIIYRTLSDVCYIYGSTENVKCLNEEIVITIAVLH